MWYRRHGYEIVARNWRCPLGEVDLIVRRGRLLVVCEVKARRTDAFGPAGGRRRPGEAAAPPPARRGVAGDQPAALGRRSASTSWPITGDQVEVIERAF